MRRSILIVDDDAHVRETLARLLKASDWDVAIASDAASCVEQYERDRPDVVVLDYGLPDLSGLQLIDALRERDPDATLLMLTGHAEIDLAVEAMQRGAENFLTKPLRWAHIQAALERACEKAEMRRQNRYYREQRAAPLSVANADVSTAGLPALREQIALLAGGTAPVLITGETGTGKGWVAKLLHAHSRRVRAPFVEVNCAGLTAAFLDAELFGYEKGAFTDARSQKPGLLEVAHGGTLFLDEIGDLPPVFQLKLLRVVESQRFRRLGGTREIGVDVRLVAATHRDLRADLKSGRFRDDLFYRLSVFPLHLPPLRERGHDAILALAQHLLHDVQRHIGRGPAKFSSEALTLLLGYSWPGNIREMRNTIERVLHVARDAHEIGVEHLPSDLLADSAAALSLCDAEAADLSLARAEKSHIARVLAQLGGNRVHAARALGIARATLYKKLGEQ